ncbi:CofD-like domain superfamily protein [Abortiporus biennis]
MSRSIPYFSLTPPNYHSSGGDSPGSSVFDLPIHPRGPDNDHARHLPTRTPSEHNANQIPLDPMSQESPSFIVVSGGTGCNSICAAFGNACYVLPVSDDGGSSSEIIRVIGGPSIGDIRSRLVRLIPSAPPGSPLDSIRNLLAYRLPAHCSERDAREEWREIVEGRSVLWSGIPNDRKELIRGFLVHFENEVLKRAHKNFSFVNGSIGNYFLSAAQEFFRSLPSAIFLFSSITNSQANIIPVIVTNHTVTIAAELENGARLVGQCEISHPIPGLNTAGVGFSITVEESVSSVEDENDDEIGGSFGRPRNVLFEATKKDEYVPLDSRICRLFYINAYGNEIHPGPNPDYLHHLATNDVLVYSCGSLWTSIVPCLALRGVACSIARSRSLRAKVLLLNAQNDRETDGYTAVDYISTIVRTLNTAYSSKPYGGLGQAATTYPVSAFVTHLVYLKDTLVEVDVDEITTLGVSCVEVEGHRDEKTNLPKFNAHAVRSAILGILANVE